MKKKLLFLAMMIAGCYCITSCSSPNLYSWYNYENVSYKYQKVATDEALEKLMVQYAKIDAKQKATRKVVPPGFKAEYGYLLYKAGKQAEGLQKMKEEITLYPESEAYIGRIIKQLEK